MPVERDYVFPELHTGMDHEHYDWSPLNASRAVLAWPENARVALCVIVTLEHMEWSRPPNSYQIPNLAGGYGQSPFPDVTAWSHREYGHRVGVFRVLRVLDKYGIKPTIAMDALTAEHYPFLVRHCLSRGDEIIGHGISVNRMITSRMSEQEERDYIQTSVQALTRATGKTPAGWLGPESGESTRTPRLLAEAGSRYVCDWVNDEHPYSLKVPRGALPALPITLPLDDVNALGPADRPRPVRPDDRGHLRDALSRGGDDRTATGAAPAPVADRAAVPHRLPGRRAGPHRAPAGGVGRHRRQDHRL